MKDKWNRYAIRSKYENGKYKSILMHRMIMDAPSEMQVDHINHNGLDNRKVNLRLCTNAQNCMNKRDFLRRPKNLKGVCHFSVNRRGRIYKYWRAQIGVAGKGIYLGCFNKADDAIKAYNNAAQKYFGEFAKLNEV